MENKQHNYVISLTSALERRKNIEIEFGKQNIPFTFFDAITPDLIEEKCREFGMDFTKSSLTKGEIACALSHFSLWHKMLVENLDYLCIFEDDIYLGENAAICFNNTYIPEYTHILRFEKCLDRVGMKKEVLGTVADRKVHRLISKHCNTAGYLITQAGARYLIEQFQKDTFLEPFDCIMFNTFLRKKDYYVLQLSPAVVMQSTGFESGLQSERKKQSEIVKRKDIWDSMRKEYYRFKSKFGRMPLDFK